MSNEIRRLDNITNTIKSFKDVTDRNESNQIDKMDIATEVFDAIDHMMKSRYSALWTKTRMDEGKNSDMWIAQLAYSNISFEQAKYGFEKCINNTEFSRLPPTIGEFIQLCMPDMSDFDLPLIDDAYLAAARYDKNCKHKSSIHPLALEAGREVGLWRLKNEPESKTRKLFEEAYKNLASKLITGENVISERTLKLCDERIVSDNKRLESDTHKEGISEQIDRGSRAVKKSRVNYKRGVRSMRQAVLNA